jgi:hypothetical protein
VRGEPLVAADLNQTTQNMSITTTGLGLSQTRVVDITAGAGAIAANAFDDGLMTVVDGAGEGNAYEVELTAAFTASTADGEIRLRDAVVVASDADTEVTLLQNKYADPQKSSTFKGNSFVGVPIVDVPAGDTAKQYFWVQRNGYCPAFVKGEACRGTSMILSSETEGRLEAMRLDFEVVETLSGGGMTVVPFDTTQIIGQMVTDAIDGEVQIVDLQSSMV